MDFRYDARTEALRAELLAFMADEVYPVEHQFADERAETGSRPAAMARLKSEARRRGLWNLFLPDSEYGAGLTNVQYAPLAEITGWSPAVAPEALNCAPPDTGNMELLALFGTEEQRERWLFPLLEGKIRSAYCMTEPGVSSSDPANLGTAIVRDGDDFVVRGRKWWSTGLLGEECALLVVMGVSDPDAPPKSRYSIVLVPADAPGVRKVRGLRMFGFTHGASGGHGEVEFDDVRIPRSALLGEEGAGTKLAQARLGPGRIHHCMRMIGMAERALELLCSRALRREAFGKRLADQGTTQDRIAEARVRIDQVRLLVLRAASVIDSEGARAARTDISAIKVAAPAVTEWVLDKAIQVYGAEGMSQDTPLAELWVQARTMRFIDGPDEVHRMVVARRELARHRPAD
ncbi:acyl-CoA dehydrogenase family protein [Amycolatopsis silviterrae]|uniref:Acyl-CoA dehydrogenase family protein n=1 Tax=Amycolatopsis silviterrae TaxID=1656914 RepID=A0ABW5H8E4_9PSEU